MRSLYSSLTKNRQGWSLLAFLLTLGCGWTAGATATAITIAGIPSSAVVGVQYKVTFTAIDVKKSTDKTYTANATLTTTPATQPTAAVQPLTVTFAQGVATAQVAFMAAGTQTLTIQAAGGGLTASFTTNAAATTASALAGCATCFASIGAGTLLVGKYPDYNVTNNLLQATHVGISTPSIAVGVAYKLPLHDFYGYTKLGCDADDLTTKRSDAKVAFCYPYKAFVSLKLTPDASQTLNGFTFGISHALHQYLDLMIGVAYSAHNEVSPGFQQAAVNVLKAQQAAKNPNYSQFSLSALEANNTQTAFDGFPTQLLNANGMTGPLIYNGGITVSHYRAGIFLGISLPVSFKGAVAGNP